MAVSKERGYIRVGEGVDIFYESAGSGTPMVFIPGWTFTTESFQYQMDYFSKTHRVVVLDPRSQGRSTTTLQGNNYATHGADLIKVIGELKLKDVVLVGWSFGCLTVWEYVRQMGLKNLKAAVCVDLSPKCLSTDSRDWVEGPLDEIAEAYRTFFNDARGQQDFVTQYASEVMVQRDLTDEEMFWINEQSLKTPHYIASSLFASGMFANNMEEAKLLNDSSVPSLSIIAEHWKDTATAFMKKHFPNTRLECLGGHMMFWEHPEKFNKILDEFLKG